MRHVLVSLALLVCGPSCDSKQADTPATKPTADQKPSAEAKAAAPAKPKAYGSEFCATIVPCFEKFEFNGNFSADVTVDIEPDGSVSAVSYAGDAPKPIQTCISEAIEAIELSDYNGKPGRTKCAQSGQLTGGSRMVMADYTYEVRDANAEDEAVPEAKSPN